MGVRVKRVYEPPAPEDGRRFLVDRLWPQGVKKEALRLAVWRADAGCGLMALSAVLLGKDNPLSCILFTPVDALERRSNGGTECALSLLAVALAV